MDMGDLSDRKALLENLQCHSFRWYLDSIYPEAPFSRGFKSIGQVILPYNRVVLLLEWKFVAA